jgi:hypothetical protein
VTDNPQEAARICKELGGRCVKLAKSPEEARELAGKPSQAPE